MDTVQVGEYLNGYQIRAVVLMDNGFSGHAFSVILGVRSAVSGPELFEYVTAELDHGMREWRQGHYSRNAPEAVRKFLFLTQLDVLAELV